MQIISSTELRKNIPRYIKQIQEDHTPLIITTQKQEPVVLLPLEEWESLKETLYLMSTPANKKRLDIAITDIKKEEKNILHKFEL